MRLKRIYLIAASLVLTSLSYGQSMYDALRFSNNDYEGTARSVALGNAFTALGGDMGAITINPASSGVYMYNEFTITPSLTNTLDKSSYLGSGTDSHRTRFGLSNVGGISTFNTGRNRGLVSLNIGVISNQTSNFVSRMGISGKQTETSKLASMAYQMSQFGINSSDITITSDTPNYPYYNTNALWEEILAWNTSLVENIYDDYTYIGSTENIATSADGTSDILYLGGPLTQSFTQQTTGYKQDITFNFGGNISHKFYFGINLTMQTLWYNKVQTLSETAENPEMFQTEFKSFRHQFRQNINGVGFNVKAGVIYRPVAGLRLGATISTPTWTRYTDENTESMESDVYGERWYEETPINSYQYKITSPLRWSAGIAYTFANKALVSLDYESTNYGAIRFQTDPTMYPDDIQYYNNENSAIQKYFKRVHNIRFGTEIKPMEQLSLRLGYNYYDSTEKDFNSAIHYASAGIGFTTRSNIFFDLAYRQQCNHLTDSFTLYDTSYLPGAAETLVNSKYLNWKVLFTFGCRF